MRTIAIYPGRFHPFHKGHAASFKQLANMFGPENTYLALSAKQEQPKSPFSAGDRAKMAMALGIPKENIISVTNTYGGDEYMKRFQAAGIDVNDTALVFGVSGKDMGTDPRFSFAPKRDGSPSYLQQYTKTLQPMTKHAYVMTTDVAEFPIAGLKMTDASQIRNAYSNGDEKLRSRILTDLYGNAAKHIKPIFDAGLLSTAASDQSLEEDWQKVNKKDKTAGMSTKAVKAYRRENPGSKLQTAVTTKPSKLKKGSKDAKRRKSFCARMSGMKKAHAGAKTKRDPNSPINKALRRWNCESIEELNQLAMLAEQRITSLKQDISEDVDSTDSDAFTEAVRSWLANEADYSQMALILNSPYSEKFRNPPAGASKLYRAIFPRDRDLNSIKSRSEIVAFATKIQGAKEFIGTLDLDPDSKWVIIEKPLNAADFLLDFSAMARNYGLDEGLEEYEVWMRGTPLYRSANKNEVVLTSEQFSQDEQGVTEGTDDDMFDLSNKHPMNYGMKKFMVNQIAKHTGYETSALELASDEELTQLFNKAVPNAEKLMNRFSGFLSEKLAEEKESELYKHHQEIRKQRGLPDPSHYKKLAKQKEEELKQLRAEIEADNEKLKEDYLDE